MSIYDTHLALHWTVWLVSITDCMAHTTCLLWSLTNVKPQPENGWSENVLIQPEPFCVHQWTRLGSQACAKGYASCHFVHRTLLQN